jgi:hypothetical protein
MIVNDSKLDPHDFCNSEKSQTPIEENLAEPVSGVADALSMASFIVFATPIFPNRSTTMRSAGDGMLTPCNPPSRGRTKGKRGRNRAKDRVRKLRSIQFACK